MKRRPEQAASTRLRRSICLTTCWPTEMTPLIGLEDLVALVAVGPSRLADQDETFPDKARHSLARSDVMSSIRPRRVASFRFRQTVRSTKAASTADVGERRVCGDFNNHMPADAAQIVREMVFRTGDRRMEQSTRFRLGGKPRWGLSWNSAAHNRRGPRADRLLAFVATCPLRPQARRLG
jgi:hypothetical protein